MVGRHLLVATAVAVGAIAGSPSNVERHSMSGFGPQQAAVVSWALDLFERAGLELPAVDFVHHESREPCHGFDGWYARGDARPRIAICTDDTGAPARFLLLHELAHAWDAANLDAARRHELLASRGLRQWWGSDHEEWATYGAEHAAETIVWGLMDRPARMARLPRPFGQCDELLAGYRMLTGSDPLHGFTDHC